MRSGGVAEGQTLESRLPVYIYIYTDMDSLIVRPLAPPPQTHTSDCPIFKISFDSENSGGGVLKVGLLNCPYQYLNIYIFFSAFLWILY